MTKQRRTRVWVVPGTLLLTLLLLLFAVGNAWTQDVFASNGGDSGSSTPPVYQDSFSNSCDKSSNSSMNVGGYNPALCSKVTAPSGQKCFPTGQDTVLVSQQGNTCYYCYQIQLPGKYSVIVPEDVATAVYQQAKGALYCGRTAADPCYWECYGNVPPVIPTAGVTPMPPAEYGVTGGTPTPSGNGAKPPIKLQGFVSNAPDPCYPAGPKNYWVCDYPNLPRPPGCNCSEKVPTQPPQQSGQPPAKPGGQPTSQPGDFTPDPNNYHLGMMVGISSCIQSFPVLGRGMGYFLVGQFENAAAMWGIEPGQSMMLKDLTTPRTDSSMTPYQQGVIAGQRICALTATHFALKGTNYVLKNLSGGDVPKLTKSTPGDGEPAGKNVEPTQPTAGEPNAPAGTTPEDKTVTTSPPSEPAGTPSAPPPDTTVVTKPTPGGPAKGTGSPNPDSTVVNPTPDELAKELGAPIEDGKVNSPEPTSAEPAEPAPIIGGDTAQDAVRGDQLQKALTNNKDNKSNAAALEGKYVELQNGPVLLGKFIAEGSLAAVFELGEGQVIKLAKSGTQTYFNDSLAGQWEGAKVVEGLQKEGVEIAAPETSEYQPGNYDNPGSFIADNTGTKFPDSYGLTSKTFRAKTPAEQAQVLDAINTLTNTLASKGYVLADINPSNFTIQKVGNTLRAILHDPDMILTMEQINEGYTSSLTDDILNGSLGTSGAGPYTSGTYPNAQALANQLNLGIKNWLYFGPQGAP